VAGKKNVRKRLFVDVKLQGALLVRLLLYWLMCLFTIGVLMHCYRIVCGIAPTADEFEVFFRSAVIGTIAFLPLALYDLMRLSNHFAGPILRLRRAMQELARDEYVDPIRFRKGDFWQEVAADFNAVAELVQARRSDQAPDTSRETADETMEPAAASR
jgi:hypothetical protein